MSFILVRLSVRGEEAWVEFNAPHNGIYREDKSVSRIHTWYPNVETLPLLAPTYWVNV